MDQHTIPEFYLKGFVDPVTPPDQEPFVWFHAHPECKWRRRSPRKLSRISNYYSVLGSDGTPDHAGEETLQGIESDAAGVIRDVISVNRALDAASRRTLSLFIASMWLRVPRLHAEIEPGMAAAFLADARLDWQSRQGNPARLAELKVTLQSALGKDADVDRIMTGPLSESEGCALARSFVVQHTLTSIRKNADRINSMKWHLLVGSMPSFFIASDWPVSLWTPEHPESNFQAGLGVPSVQLTFALNQRTALFAEWPGQEGYYEAAAAELVANVNQRTARLAATLYSPEAGFPGIGAITFRAPESMGG